METKPLLYGLIGFFIGGFIVSVAAVTFDKPAQQEDGAVSSMASGMHMSMTELEGKTGDDFDAAFIADMIEHHQGAIDMAKLANSRAKHQEIKQLSNDIIAAQQAEIEQMRKWQKTWDYSQDPSGHGQMQGH